MSTTDTYHSALSLPAPMSRLSDLAYNLRWTWDHPTQQLFARLGGDQWERAGHNPVLMLKNLDRSKLEAAARDEDLLAELGRIAESLDEYMDGGSTWFDRIGGDGARQLIAYFCAEFGLTEALPIYSGGLGVLAGDHLKSASDLGVPLVAVGLLYRHGYFTQYLDESGWQQEKYDPNVPENLPLVLERSADGSPLTVEMLFPARAVAAQVWRAQVGRVPLYLLDTDVPSNNPQDRAITDQLYGGDVEIRVQQEIVLGIGGLRALTALGVEPAVCHMNEGHSAFLSLERARRLMDSRGISFADAREEAAAGLVFTTHTPVEAGHDYFPPELLDRYFSRYLNDLGISEWEFLALGRRNPYDNSEYFCMTVLALHMSERSNGVSELHGQVSRRMWHGIYPGTEENQVPIGHITNGIHLQSFLSASMSSLLDDHLGSRWREEPSDPELWQQVEGIPAADLWRAHEERRDKLIGFVRQRVREQRQRHGASREDLEATARLLDPRALTIGFARRFAMYKRATLLLRDPERLARILNAPERPVQVVFAGKAHPRDNGGKELIQRLVTLSRQEPFRDRLIFLEGYDLGLARYLVQGVDIWLNNPQRPLEASGTSGMKAAANGILNVSTLDGWWAEAWSQTDTETDLIGWAIGQGETYTDTNYQAQVEAEALYDVLEREVVPAFYERDADGVPEEWVGRMRASIRTLSPVYNTHRMVREYTERYYLPAAASHAPAGA